MPYRSNATGMSQRGRKKERRRERENDGKLSFTRGVPEAKNTRDDHTTMLRTIVRSSTLRADLDCWMTFRKMAPASKDRFSLMTRMYSGRTAMRSTELRGS